MTIREVVDKFEALRQELGGGHVSALFGKHNTRIEFTISVPNDESMQGRNKPPRPPAEKVGE